MKVSFKRFKIQTFNVVDAAPAAAPIDQAQPLVELAGEV